MTTITSFRVAASLIGIVGALTTAPLATAAETVDAFGVLHRAGQAAGPAPNGLYLHVGNNGSQYLKAFRFTLAGGATYNTAAQSLPDNCSLTSPAQVVCALNSPPGNVIDFGFDTAPRYADCAGGKLEVSAVGASGPFITQNSASGPAPSKKAACASVNYATLAPGAKQSGRGVRGRVTGVPTGATVRVDLTRGSAPALLGTVAERNVRSTAVGFTVKLNARGLSALKRAKLDYLGGRSLVLNVRVTTTLGSERSVTGTQVVVRA